MSDSKGWIKLHRTTLYHNLWDDKPFAKGQAWVDLLLLANHEDKKTIYQGKFTEFKRGTVNRSLLSLADRWGWDRKKVRNFMALLECEGMITMNATRHGTTITIVNYGLYQGSGDNQAENQTENDSLTRGQPLPINKNEKNEKNEKKKKIVSGKHKYGTYQNVLLSDEEMEKLKKEYPSDYERRIDNLDEYIAMKGDKYKNHLAVIRNWARSENNKGGHKQDVNSDQRKEYTALESLFD